MDNKTKAEQYVLSINTDLVERLTLLLDGELTQTQIAEQCGVSQAYIAKLMKRHAPLFNKDK